MSTATVGELVAICGENRCWRTREVAEAGVVAKLGAHWRVLLLDFHFSSCVGANHRRGGLCDGVAAYPQDSNNSLRLIELKQSVDDAPDALPQLAKGGTLVGKRLADGLKGLDVVAEIHVKRAPRQTLRYQNEILIGLRKIEVMAVRDGDRV